MTRHLAITITNRTTTEIKFNHQSYTDTIPSLHTTLTKAIPSEIPLKRLKSYAIYNEELNLIEIKFKKIIKPLSNRKFSKLSFYSKLWNDSIESNSTSFSSNYQKILKPKFEIFQSTSDDGSITFMAIFARKMSDWMSDLPDELPVTSITLPGTHNTCALYGWPIGTCHTRPISRQLSDGIRFLDLRLSQPKRPNPTLVLYHGIQSQYITFQEVLNTLYEFLKSHSKETIVVSIKQEDFTKGFSDAVLGEIFKNKEMWWLEKDLPSTLSLARGKLILFSRFGHDKNHGIHLPIWPNNSGDVWETEIKGAQVAVQDWYQIGSFFAIPKKFNLVCTSLCRSSHHKGSLPIRSRMSQIIPSIQINETEISEMTETSERIEAHHSSPTWIINYLSASSLFFAFPNIVARGFGFHKLGLGIEGINYRLARWLTERRKFGDHSIDLLGVVCLMDFYHSPKDSLVSLLVDCNF
ncbi:PLC-like phosphodiesterase [Melampsora americana]|nr:PLC-like phosphodiesterase [Melampsora americana]